MKKLDPKLVTRESFQTDRGHEAALYAVSICNRMLELHKHGHLILCFENLVKPQFRIELHSDGTFEGLYLKDSEECWVQIVGDETYDSTPIVNHYGQVVGHTRGKIYCTKRDIREYFKLWRVARITHVVKAIDLA